MGKGSEWRKGTDFKKYRDGDFWKSIEKKQKKDDGKKNK